MNEIFISNKIRWIDVLSPKQEEILELLNQFDLPVGVGEEATLYTIENKVKVYDDLIYAILHFPIINTEGTSSRGEIDFIIKKDVLITIRYESHNTMYQLKKKLDTDNMTSEKNLISSIDSNYNLFILMLEELYQSVANEVEVIRSEIETNIENNKINNKDTVRKTAKYLKDMIRFQEQLNSHNEIIEKLKDLEEVK